MTILFTEPSFVPVSGNSVVYPGAKLFFYETGTSTLQNTYSEYTLTTAHANPVVADADGRFAPIYLDPSLEDYKVVLKDSSDVTIWTVDPYSAVNNTTNLGTISDLLVASTALGTVSVNGYHTAGDGGGGEFYWDASQDKANHNGGTIIDADVTFPSDWTNQTQVTTWFTAGSGTGCWVRLGGDYFIEAFGARKNDTNYAASNYKSIRAALKFVLSQVSADTSEWESIDTVPTLRAGPGSFWIQGNSPFGLNRAEIAALGIGSSSFRRGFKLKGSGRKSTIFTLKNTGAETWFYSNENPSSPSTTSTAQYFSWEGFTIRAEHLTPLDNRRYKEVAANTINGFSMESQGWEAFWLYSDFTVEGLDTVFKWRGQANCDQHTFYGCRFEHIIDTVFDIDNDQSVVNRMYGCDVFTYGDVFRVGPFGGGDFLWMGGTLHQDSAYVFDAVNTGGVTSAAAAAADPRAMLHYDQGTVSTGAASGFSNSNYHFINIRVENYDAYNHLVRAVRDDVDTYGAGYATFDNCDFSVNFELPDGLTSTVGGTNRTAGSNSRNLVEVKRMSCDIAFNRCQFSSHQNFYFEDVGDASNITGSANVRLTNPILSWETTSSSAGKGPLSDKVTKVISASDRCNINFEVQGSTTPLIALSNEPMACNDFSYTSSQNGPGLDNLKWANAKPSSIPWPSVPDSTGILYLPPGSIVTSVFVNKPAGVGTGSATYFLSLLDNAGNTIYTTGAFTEEDSFTSKAELTTPHVVPANPNNWVRIRAFNGSAVNVTQSNQGQFLVGYFSGSV